MTVRIHVSAEAEDFDNAFAKLSAVVRGMSLSISDLRDKAPRGGLSESVMAGEENELIGVYSIEDDSQMNGRMPLRRVLDKARQQMDFERNAERDEHSSPVDHGE
jgi:hypothetical protein